MQERRPFSQFRWWSAGLALLAVLTSPLVAQDKDSAEISRRKKILLERQKEAIQRLQGLKADILQLAADLREQGDEHRAHLLEKALELVEAQSISEDGTSRSLSNAMELIRKYIGNSKANQSDQAAVLATKVIGKLDEVIDVLGQREGLDKLEKREEELAKLRRDANRFAKRQERLREDTRDTVPSTEAERTAARMRKELERLRNEITALQRQSRQDLDKLSQARERLAKLQDLLRRQKRINTETAVRSGKTDKLEPQLKREIAELNSVARKARNAAQDSAQKEKALELARQVESLRRRQERLVGELEARDRMVRLQDQLRQGAEEAKDSPLARQLREAAAKATPDNAAAMRKAADDLGSPAARERAQRALRDEMKRGPSKETLARDQRSLARDVARTLERMQKLQNPEAKAAMQSANDAAQRAAKNLERSDDARPDGWEAHRKLSVARDALEAQAGVSRAERARQEAQEAQRRADAAARTKNRSDDAAERARKAAERAQKLAEEIQGLKEKVAALQKEGDAEAQAKALEELRRSVQNAARRTKSDSVRQALNETARGLQQAQEAGEDAQKRAEGLRAAEVTAALAAEAQEQQGEQVLNRAKRAAQDARAAARREEAAKQEAARKGTAAEEAERNATRKDVDTKQREEAAKRAEASAKRIRELAQEPEAEAAGLKKNLEDAAEAAQKAADRLRKAAGAEKAKDSKRAREEAQKAAEHAEWAAKQLGNTQRGGRQLADRQRRVQEELSRMAGGQQGSQRAQTQKAVERAQKAADALEQGKPKEALPDQQRLQKDIQKLAEQARQDAQKAGQNNQEALQRLQQQHQKLAQRAQDIAKSLERGSKAAKDQDARQRLDRARQRTEEAEKELRRSLRRLGAAEPKKAEEHRKEAERLAEEARKDLEGVRERHQRPDQAGQRRLEDLEKKQKQLEDDVKRLEERMKKANARPAAERLQDAQSAMRRAREAMRRGDVDEAEREQAEAQKQLEQARDRVEEDERRYRTLRQYELLFRLKEELRAYKRQVTEFGERLADIDAQVRQDGRVTRAVRRARLEPLGKEIAQLALDFDEKVAAIEKEGAVVYTYVLKQCKADLGEVVTQLKLKETGDVPQELLSDVAIRLDQALKGLERDLAEKRADQQNQQNQQDGQNGQQGGQGQQPKLVSTAAEIRMILVLQRSLNEETENFFKGRPAFGEKGASDAERARLERFSHRQGSLAELFEELRDRAFGAPGKPPLAPEGGGEDDEKGGDEDGEDAGDGTDKEDE